MPTVSFEISESVLAGLRDDPDQFGRDLRLAAAVKWYETGKVSQGRAAEIAGLSRAEFLVALARFGTTPFQASPREISKEISSG
ncbi:MAG: UPF0175 family protein [Candidatus Hydrogenedentota bacterium]|nr:MAG: UPF0175 family protein [Candidatus Hydrogenedentota bacterium]